MKQFGTVKVVKSSYGFIKYAAGEMYFHFSECANKEHGVPVGTCVEFEVGEWKGRPAAKDVVVLPEEVAHVRK